MSVAKVSKYSGWLLFLLIVIYVVTGLSYAGYFGFENLIDVQTASLIHNNLYLLAVLLVLMFLHCCLRFLIRLKNRFRKKEGPAQGPPQTVAPQPMSPQETSPQPVPAE